MIILPEYVSVQYYNHYSATKSKEKKKISRLTLMANSSYYFGSPFTQKWRCGKNKHKVQKSL